MTLSQINGAIQPIYSFIIPQAAWPFPSPPCFLELIIDLPDLLDKRGGKKLAKIEYWISGRGRQRRWTLVTLNSKRYNDDEVIYEKGIQCHH